MALISKIRIISFILFCAFFPGTGFSQALPPTVDPGRIQSDLRKEREAKPAKSTENIIKAAVTQAPEGAGSIFFVLRDVEISGNSRISRRRFETIYKDLIGNRVSLLQIYEVVNQINKIYTDEGYLLSRAQVPPQTITDGHVKINVIEGYISNYILQGNFQGNERQISSLANKIVNSGPLTSAALERYLLLMNDLPGIRVRSALSPSETIPGTAEMTLVVEQDKVSGFSNLDNFGSSYIGPFRLTAGMQINSLFNSSDQWNATFLTAPGHDELRYYSLATQKSIGDEGTKLGLATSYSKSNPSLPPLLGGLLEPQGKSYSVTTSLDHPFIRSRNLNVSAGVSFDITKSKTDFAPGLAAIETRDNQRIIRANSEISYLDDWNGFNAFSGSVSQGLELFGSSEKGDAKLSRPLGDPRFTKVSGEISRLQHLYGPLSVLIGVAGQYSFEPLLSSEEFGFGGSGFGRGYDTSQITGDQGIGSKIEFDFDQVLPLRYLNAYQVYTFYDFGKVWHRDPSVGQEAGSSAASAGLGTRFSLIRNIKGDAFMAKPLTQDIPSRGVEANNWRFQFSLTSNF